MQYLPCTTYRKRAEVYLKDFIQERLEAKSNDSIDKPEDLLQWLIDAAPPIEKTVPQLAERLMALNVASIHTTVIVCRFEGPQPQATTNNRGTCQIS